MLRGSNVACHFEIQDDLWNADLDTGQFSQVVHNLVINAMQAMPAGGTVAVRCWNVGDTPQTASATPLGPGAWVAVSITDEGVGIRPEHLGKVFDPYFTTKPGGHGLGLATWYSAVKAHGGHISVTSSVGRGTLLCGAPARLHARADSRGRAAPSAAVRKPVARVLVMDDEHAVRDIAVRMLTWLGYEAEAVADGRQAITRYSRPDRAADLRCRDDGFDRSGWHGRARSHDGAAPDRPGIRAIVSSGYPRIR